MLFSSIVVIDKLNIKTYITHKHSSNFRYIWMVELLLSHDISHLHNLRLRLHAYAVWSRHEFGHFAAIFTPTTVTKFCNIIINFKATLALKPI